MLDVLLWLVILWCVEWVVKLLRENWAAIKGAPLFMIPILLIGGVGGYIVATRLDNAAREGDRSARVADQAARDVLAERLRLSNDRLASVRASFGTDNPSEIITLLTDPGHKLVITDIQPRRLSEESKRLMSEILKGAPENVKIDYDIALGGSTGFVEDLTKAFTMAGWHVKHELSVGNPNSSPKGVTLLMPGPAQMNFGSLIAKALSVAKIAFDIREGRLINEAGNVFGAIHYVAEIVVSPSVKSDLQPSGSSRSAGTSP
jgi:hypothetical protein